METRKIQKTGGSTYTVSLPKEWVEGEIQAGESIQMEKVNGKISLDLFGEKEKSQASVVLNAPDGIEILKRDIVGLYLNGTQTIRIKDIENIEEIKKFVREVLIGVEITRVENDSLEIKNLFRSEDLSSRNGLRRMDSTVKSMMDDIESNPERVREMEDVLDKYYILLLRQLVLSQRNLNVGKKLEVEENLKAMDYRLIAKSIERIGDHLVEISKHEKDYDQGLDKLKPIYGDLSTAIFDSEQKKAENIVKVLREVNTEDRNIERIRRLMLDISNTVINFSIMDSDRVKILENKKS
ncbi:hypothetical protein AQV86_06115 [Nanohaloarchaea archaeon SG9]|nr:hypothetical protein AQV86_06115 [Nanohaloarchaea archaeon SG9]